MKKTEQGSVIIAGMAIGAVVLIGAVGLLSLPQPEEPMSHEWARVSNALPLSEPSERLVTSARVLSVYDGDTIVVELTKQVRIRMLDCWAPEVRTKDKDEKVRGYASKAFLQSMLAEGDVVLVDIPMTGKLQDSLTFGRVLAYIYKDTDDDGELDNISDEMVEGGHATKEKQ